MVTEISMIPAVTFLLPLVAGAPVLFGNESTAGFSRVCRF
jgi:hypothetical protein